MKFLGLLLGLLFACASAVAQEKTLIATGDWSEETAGLRGRMLLYQGRVLGEGPIRETLIYLELENSRQTSSGTLAIDFDPQQLHCELFDTDSRPVPEQRSGGSGGRPGRNWVSLPFDSTIRLRVNPYAFGRAPSVGLLIPLAGQTWLIPAGDTRDYFLSASFTVQPPKDHGRDNAWVGKLSLPKMKITLPKP